MQSPFLQRILQCLSGAAQIHPGGILSKFNAIYKCMNKIIRKIMVCNFYQTAEEELKVKLISLTNNFL